MDTPGWFTELNWSTPAKFDELRTGKTSIPPGSGVYIFTNYAGPLVKNYGVLYVGKANSLALRVRHYLHDPAEVPIYSRKVSGRMASGLKHPGKTQLLVQIAQYSRNVPLSNVGIWIRWQESSEPLLLEKKLIMYLQPAFNTQGKGA